MFAGLRVMGKSIVGPRTIHYITHTKHTRSGTNTHADRWSDVFVFGAVVQLGKMGKIAVENLRSFCSGSVALAERLWRRRRWSLGVLLCEVQSSYWMLSAWPTHSTAGWPGLPSPRLENSLRFGNSATCARCCCQLFRLEFSYFQLLYGKPPSWDTIGRKPWLQSQYQNSDPQCFQCTMPSALSDSPQLHIFIISWTILVGPTNK